ncbi:DUF2254 domain-containing protein [Noviherbaspirillum pedocola]|uniref:DUF2254 domain-containing protein n=1 Tax=Noviherbaspirillum pedocola TaxID=2801341 RepID=A0A934SWW4_9BURK|nr:DUF2254 domain-containing protein [Noviherbaspirillum pedocola]MBK4736566.1 DUF2254 domain-containing protein [Noviherbaspirillum pedocola]
MRVLLNKYWEYLSASLWFLPSLMAGAAIVLAQLMVEMDRRGANAWLSQMSWIYGGGAEGASAVLQTIAGSMINIAGVVFSLTLVALSLTSSQFGPRLLRNFMRDRSNQLVLGTFLATFLYCLVVLRTVRHEDYGAFTPHLSVTVAVVFALASLWVLIYFIHHVSMSIQADEVISRAGTELQQVMDRLFPERIGQGKSERGEHRDHDWESRALAAFREGGEQQIGTICVPRDGYLQMIDADALISAACAGDMALRLERRPGQYLVEGMPLLSIWPAQRLEQQLADRLLAAFAIGAARTPTQDIEFAVLQLVEVGVRALSPGTNDPFTAIACIDRLSAALHHLARRDMPDACRYDKYGKLRLKAMAADFPSIVDVAFNQLRQYASGNVDVMMRMLEAIATVAPACTREADTRALQRHAEMIAAAASRSLQEENDAQAVAQRYHAVRQALARKRAE